MNAAELMKYIRNELSEKYSTGEAAALARAVLTHISGRKFTHYETDRLPSEMVIMAEAMLQRLKQGEPLQYITGTAFFRDIEIKVSPAVLIPRPETEELIGLIEQETVKLPEKIIDLCTGSGCIALALKKLFPEASVTATDVSLEALQLADNNATELQLPVKFLWMDMLSDEFPEDANQKYDLIVSNPPYISHQEIFSMHSNVKDHEPHIALFAPAEDPLLFYRKIAVFAADLLNRNGTLWLEINPLFADDTSDILRRMQFRDVRIYEDLSGKDRFISATSQAS